MKKTFIAFIWLLAFFSLAAPAAAAAQPEIADVPPSHWAYQAVKQLVSQGYLGLYPDKTFRGDQPVDRYTMAVVIARLLSEAVAGKTTLSKEDADLLRRLTAEFRQELVAVSMRTKTLEEAVARYDNERKALGADLAAARDELAGTKAELAEIRDELAESAREIVAVKERIVRLEDSYAALSQETIKLEGSVETLSREVASLEGRLGDLAAETKARDEANAAAIAEAGRFSDVGRKDLAELSQRMAILEDELRTWKYITVGLAILAGLLL